MDRPKEMEIDLYQIASIIRVRIVWILLAAALLGTATWAGTKFLIVPQYTASVSLYVYSDTNRAAEGTAAITSSELTASKSLVDTYIVILKSKTVLNQIIEDLGLGYSVAELKGMISAAAVNSTEVFSVSVTDTDPKMARTIANKIGDIAPEEIIRVVKAGGVEVVDYAETPTSPSSPNVMRNTAVGALLGLVLSIGAFIIFELLNTKIRSEEDLENNFDIPVLGCVPRLTEPKEEK